MKVLMNVKHLGDDEVIQLNDMHSLDGISLHTIKSLETVGMTVRKRKEINKNRQFYRIIDAYFEPK